MIIIGEKISVIAKKVREAMDARDPKPIQELADTQWKAGAHFIDVNIGPAEDKGEDLMKWMVESIQQVVQAPLCLDTTNASALEAGLQAHNNEWGRALINSTSNDPERFPILELAAKHNAEIIALTVGKGGLPADAEERCGKRVRNQIERPLISIHYSPYYGMSQESRISNTALTAGESDGRSNTGLPSRSR